MNDIQAKGRIISLYKDGEEAFNKVKLDEYKQLLYAIRSHLTSGNAELKAAVGTFLIHGACKYDRFVELRPQYVDENLFDIYCDFLDALQILDGKSLGRTSFFHLERIYWEIFTECSLLPYDDEMEYFLKQCEENIQKYTLTEGDERIVNNIKIKKERLLGLINNIRNGSIRTIIHTTLPYHLANADATVTLHVDDVLVTVKVSNHSQGSSLPGTSIAEGSTMTTSGPSKWTITTCDLEIEAVCMMDGLELQPCVTLQKKEDGRFWISTFDFTYKVLSAVWIYLQQHEDISGTWPPLPNDIHYIDYRVFAGDKEYDHEITTNPALVYKVTSLKKEPQNYVIEDEKPNWSVYAYQFAKVYAESGQLKESIFWLNVSVEALVEEFIHKTAKTEDELKEFEAEESNFAKAEEELAKQFPDMKGKVQWPESTHHASVFTKLKRAVNKSPLAARQKDILKNYSRVNAKRNDLFHGNSVEISVEDVEKAFNAYGWLKEKLV